MARVKLAEIQVRYTFLPLPRASYLILLPKKSISKTNFSILNSCRKLESMVRSRRPSIYYCLIMYGPTHDSGTRLPVLWTSPPKVCTLHDLGVYGIFLSHRFPMVLLGVFAGFQPFCNKWIYWRPGTFWSDGHTWNAFTWISSYS